ncbi:MAG: metallophosphoesterase [Prolixibacteraceae bacterium]|nr:metallophosphoesterase [Prolixibacteraceae bacterium]
MEILKTILIGAAMLLISDISLAKKTDIVRFGICSDAHLSTMHNSEYRITTFINSMKKEKPDFLIELGDFATPEPKYAPYFAIWNSFPGDKYHVIGNHEMDGGYSREQTLAYLKMKSSYYSFDKKGFHFIVLDGNDKKDPNVRGYKQFMAAEQVNWLKGELSTTKLPVVIFSHQGLTLYTSEDETYGIENWKEVQEILVKHNQTHPGRRVVACFNGHTHYDDAIQIDGIWYITITSMSYHWLGEKYAHATYGDEVDKQFKWIKYTAPFKEPLFTVVEISPKGMLKIAGKKTQWVGATPAELGYLQSRLKYMRPEISKRRLKLSL